MIIFRAFTTEIITHCAGFSRNTADDAEASTSSQEPGGPSQTVTKDAEELPTEDIEAKIAESKRMAWGGQEPQASPSADTETAEQPKTQQSISESSPKQASELSIEELEAELKRRRSAANTTS